MCSIGSLRHSDKEIISICEYACNRISSQTVTVVGMFQLCVCDCNMYIFLSRVGINSTLWSDQLRSGIGRVWEFTYLTTSPDTLTQGGEYYHTRNFIFISATCIY